MQPNKTDILQMRFHKSTMKLAQCWSLRQIAMRVQSHTTEAQRVQYVSDFSDTTDALIVELSHFLNTSTLPSEILAKYPDEAVFTLYQRYQLVAGYLQEVNIGEAIEAPTDECEFFQFMLIDFLVFLT